MSPRENSDAKWDDKKDMRKRRVKKVKESESANGGGDRWWAAQNNVSGQANQVVRPIKSSIDKDSVESHYVVKRMREPD